MVSGTPPWPSKWAFGLEPLPSMLEFADAVRSLTEAVLSLDAPFPQLDQLVEQIRTVDAELRGQAHVTPSVRVGAGADDVALRPYLDHSIHVGGYNPAFPTYGFAEIGPERATGSVRFSAVYEGPPGFVHGGFLAVFFDLVIGHHNSENGISGKTKSLELRYRRPVPLGVQLDFEVDRHITDNEIVSEAVLSGAAGLLCRARAVNVAGRRADMPRVGGRSAPADRR
jgi:hypothetical protein